MAVTAQKSPQVAAYEAGTPLDTLEHGRVEWVHFRHTQSGAGDQGSTADLVYMPAGKLRIVPRLSSVQSAAIANGAVGIGHAAGYATPDGTAVAASAAAFASAQSLATAGTNPLNGGVAVDVSSRGNWLARATFTGTGGIPDGAVIEGAIAFVRG